jgi:hypothetical protein
LTIFIYLYYITISQQKELAIKLLKDNKGQKFQLNETMYFIIDDFDVRYFEDKKIVLTINTYPIKPDELGNILFQVQVDCKCKYKKLSDTSSSDTSQ